MAKNRSTHKSNVKVSTSLAGGLGWSAILHLLVLIVFFTTMSFSKSSPPIMVSLSTDPGKAIKPIKAGLVDKRPYELAQQQRLEAERLLKQQLLEQEQAQKALELAKIKKYEAEQAKLAAEAAAKLAAQQKAQQKQLELKQSKEKKVAEKKSAEKKAAAIKADQTKLQAQHNEVLLQEVDKYKALFAAAIEEKRIINPVYGNNIQCKIRIRLFPDGSIISVKISQPSGNPAYDKMSADAVKNAAPFAMPEDQELLSKLLDLEILFKNGEQADA